MNYEALVNLFNTKTLDLSEIPIYSFPSTQMTKEEQKEFLNAFNLNHKKELEEAMNDLEPIFKKEMAEN
jgi:hypothetical protein